MSLLLSMLLAAGGCACPRPVHFVDLHGNELKSLEPCWQSLHRFFGEATPERITIGYTPESASSFSVGSDSITVSMNEWATNPAPIVAHESSHLALSHLTQGASATEPFRFLDEGLAEYLQHVVAGDLPAYREEALAVAAADRARGAISFAAMRSWQTCFGRPPKRNLRAYAAGASVVFFLVERWGEPKLRAFFAELGRTRDLDQATRAKIELSVEQLEAGWTAWLKTQRPAMTDSDEPLRIVRFSPAQGSKSVSAALREVEVELSSDMFGRAPLCLQTPCNDGLCYTEAYWKSPRILAVRAPKGLRAGTRYELRIGAAGCQIQSRSGEKLPVTEWSFQTR
ncbi:MAG TPA: hypothetical protein DFS52_17600 [Myxococcales bacterium]|mgnify:FL=1|jgi:hypothetical protein|nr:hypothetical protein [Myxococcales bacterium]